MKSYSGVKASVNAGLCKVVQSIPEVVQTSWGTGRWQETISGGELELPVVDVSQSTAKILDDIRKACQEWGSFQVIGHEISLHLMEDMIQICHGFFDAPDSERMKYYSEDIKQPFRWATGQNFATRKTPLWVDYIYMACKPFPKQDEFPSEKFREVAETYSIQARNLATKLIELISESLGLDPSVLQKKSNKQHVMRLNYYPSCPTPESVIGASPHTDVNAFSILQQQLDVDGYETLHNGQWVGIKPKEGALLFIVGDQLEILSNGRCKSAVHRAMVNSKQARVSVASFFAPSDEEHIAPLLKDEDPAFTGTTYRDYFKMYFDLIYTPGEETALDKLKV